MDHNLLVNYREFFVAPRSVDEAIAFAREVRERARDTTKSGSRPPVNHSSSLQDAEDIPDDAFSSAESESEGDTDQVGPTIL